MRNSVKLQLAADIADTKRLLEIAAEVHDVIDILEVGTPVVLKEGLRAVRTVKEHYPDLTVLADTKIADAGSLECGDTCDFGADIITVMAFSDDATIADVVKTAHARGRLVLADMLCISDLRQRARELDALGVDYVCVHTGVDMQKRGRTPIGDLQELVQAIPSGKCAVAGGISMETIDACMALQPGIIIAGGALYNAPDIRKAATKMKARM